MCFSAGTVLAQANEQTHELEHAVERPLQPIELQHDSAVAVNEKGEDAKRELKQIMLEHDYL